MKVLMVEPGKMPYETKIGTGLEALQGAVGRSIQTVYPYFLHILVDIFCLRCQFDVLIASIFAGPAHYIAILLHARNKFNNGRMRNPKERFNFFLCALSTTTAQIQKYPALGHC